MRFVLEVPKPPGQVFAEVGDFDRLASWDPMANSVERFGESLQPGTRYRLYTPLGLSLDYEVVASDPPRRIVYRGGTIRVTSTDTIEVVPDGSGSRLTITSVLRFRGRMRLAAPIVIAVVWLVGRFRSLPSLRRHLRRI